MVRLLKRLLEGSPCTVLQTFAAYNSHLHKRFSLYNHIECSSCPPPSDIPWPVYWLIMNHARKHRLVSHLNSAPALEWAIKDSQSFVNKVAWRLHHKSADPPTLPFRRKPTVAHCPHIVDPDFRPWASCFRRVFLTRIRSLLGGNHSNTYGLIVFALKQLKTLPYAILMNDKDNGFSVVPIEHMQQVEHKALNPKMYVPVSLPHYEFKPLLVSYRSMSRRIEKLEEVPGLASWINASLSGPLATTLGYTVKTHKPIGQQTLRTIHKVVQAIFVWFG